jgi:hypothetical protein
MKQLKVLFAVSALTAATVGAFAAPSISLTPDVVSDLEVNDEVIVTIMLDTDGGLAKGGGVEFAFSTAVWEVVGGVSGIVVNGSSPYNLTPVPSIVGSTIEIGFLEPGFNDIAYQGALASFTIKAIGTPPVEEEISHFQLVDDTSTRFTPDLAGTIVDQPEYRFASSVSDWYLFEF